MAEHEKKVLTVQDISCVGQCSLTVALPIISACGIETAILPSAVLSTHTGGFSGWTFRDLTDDIPGIVDHWEKEKISFDAIYTGYLGSKRQIALVKDIFERLAAPSCVRVVDPAMADNGQLYYGFDEAFAHEMATLCGVADIALPNITEAAMMTDMPFLAEGYDESYIKELMTRVLALGAKTVVLTGVSYKEGELGVAVLSRGDSAISYYFHERLPKSCHGTGDIFASAFVGGLVSGKTPLEAATLAADFTLCGIRLTQQDETHWYGTKFERALPMLVRELNK
ncbi:MAG: pyridoxamine kinase [Ruminococcaceae bacterium]|nr:pyridoxamine kinase [Oscillospiraceae bacterium]